MTHREDREARTLAKELLDTQLGSKADAIDLLDSFPPGEQRDRIIYWIDQLGEDPDDR